MDQFCERFQQHWRLLGHAPPTAANYVRCVRRLTVPLDEVTYDDLIEPPRRARRGATPNGLAIEVRAFRAFFRWFAEMTGAPNPAAKLRSVKVPETPVKSVSETEHRTLLAQCTSLAFLDRRDRAILAVLWSTWMRRSECARIELDHLDLTERTITIPRSTTGRLRVVGLDAASVRYVQRWLQARNRHRLAHSSYLWISHRGRLTSDGLMQAIHERAVAAGVHVSAHQYRRALAERWLQAGGSETLLMRHTGWSSPSMVAKYTRANGERLALAEHRKLLG